MKYSIGIPLGLKEIVSVEYSIRILLGLKEIVSHLRKECFLDAESNKEKTTMGVFFERSQRASNTGISRSFDPAIALHAYKVWEQRVCYKILGHKTCCKLES